MFNPASAIEKTATGKRLVVVSLLNVLIRFGAMPWLHQRSMPADSPGPLDLMFGYSANEAAARIASFSDAGRAGYRMFLLTGDVVYPITYTLIFVWAIAILKRHTTRTESPLIYAAPIAAFGFDMLENLTISVLLTIYPDQPAALGWAASLFTTLKWLSVVASVVVIMILIAVGPLSKKARVR